jgi:hypothetical protein
VEYEANRLATKVCAFPFVHTLKVTPEDTTLAASLDVRFRE